MKWYLNAIQNNYANFNGRARRKEYWMFYIFNISFFGLTFLIDAGINPKEQFVFIPAAMTFLYPFFMTLPTLAITTRRLHDIDLTGKWLLVILLPLIAVAWYFNILEIVWFIPILGPLFIFILLTKNGKEGSNSYGPDPKPESEYPVK